MRIIQLHDAPRHTTCGVGRLSGSITVQDGDGFEISAPYFFLPLRNPLRKLASQDVMVPSF